MHRNFLSGLAWDITCSSLCHYLFLSVTVLTHCLPQSKDQFYASNVPGGINGRDYNRSNGFLLLLTPKPQGGRVSTKPLEQKKVFESFLAHSCLPLLSGGPTVMDSVGLVQLIGVVKTNVARTQECSRPWTTVHCPGGTTFCPTESSLHAVVRGGTRPLFCGQQYCDFPWGAEYHLWQVPSLK
jgi:hypothetical protein